MGGIISVQDLVENQDPLGQIGKQEQEPSKRKAGFGERERGERCFDDGGRDELSEADKRAWCQH